MSGSKGKSPEETAAAERIAAARRNIGIVEEFMDDIEKIGGKVPGPLRKAVDRYLLALKLGTDAAEAANEVSQEIRSIYADMYVICREKTGALPGQPMNIDQADEYFICQARVDRGWQARNVQKVLSWEDDRSWVRKVWDKWWNRLLDLTNFVGDAKTDANLPVNAPRPM